MIKKITTNTLKRIYLFFVALLISQFGIAQGSGWEMVWSENSELGTVKAFSFVPGDDALWETGYAALFDGRILKTTDNGETWTELTAVVPEYIWGVSFATEDTGYVAGQAGNIYKTVDGGLSWSSVYFNSGDSFNKVAFKDANNGVATGYPNIIYTSDGGATWGSVANNTNNFWGLDYAGGDSYYGVEAFSGLVGRSTDNGETWGQAYNTGLDLTICVNFYDENIGVVGGGGGNVYVTTDGGTSWQNHGISSVEILAVCWFDADTVWASGDGVFKSTDQGASWVQDTTIFAAGLYNRELFVNGMNTVFTAGANIGTGDKQIWRKVGPPPFAAYFEADVQLTCTGSSVDFTDLSVGIIDTWSWTFEGGTPATSTDQNPTVTYNTPGEYDVQLTITDGVNTNTITKTDYITVLETPAKADTPLGEAEVCTGQVNIYDISEVPYAQSYEWEISPSGAGTITENGIEASIQFASDWTGDFTLKVRATNICGNGDWSDNLEGSLYQSPDAFGLEGGGIICDGEDGVEITLDGSQTDIEYELFLDGVSTGIIIDGTGAALSFGLVTEAGFYTAIGSNDNCNTFMTNQVMVTISPLPSTPAQAVGPEVICLETSSDYTSSGGEDTDSYVWDIFPSEAGMITADGLEATVEWDAEFQGMATISLFGVNDCGDGDMSEGLDVSVGAPNPTVSGEEMVCDWSDEVYEVAENDGSTYTWEVTGGTITQGQGTFIVTVAWSGEGNGTISVEEETADGCSGSSEIFDVVIDDCTGIGEGANQDNISFYPNPANDVLHVTTDSGNSGILRIYNLTGQIMLEKEIEAGEATQQIDISQLTSGLYLVWYQSGDHSLTKRLSVN